MTKKTRRKIDAALKAKIALEAVREQATVSDLAHLVEALVDVWQTLGIPFVEPPADLHVDEKSDERCAYPEIKLAAQ